jgi:hypothetical protein
MKKRGIQNKSVKFFVSLKEKVILIFKNLYTKSDGEEMGLTNLSIIGFNLYKKS